MCDPNVKQSIFFTAANNVNVTSRLKGSNATCFGMKMTKERGVVKCQSVAEAAGQYIWNWWHGLVVPDFDPLNAVLLTEEIFSNHISSLSKYIIVNIMYLSIDLYLSFFCKNYTASLKVS